MFKETENIYNIVLKSDVVDFILDILQRQNVFIDRVKISLNY